MELRNAWDVVVVGAGPGGVTTAAAFAERGASVLLLEAAPEAARRLAGEWLHPPAVDALRELDLLPQEVVASHPAGRGFVVFPDDGGEPIRLPYGGSDRAISLPHDRLVEGMRARVRARGGVHYLEGARAGALGADGALEIVYGGSTRTVHAEHIVGADGKSSGLRRQLIGGEMPAAISHMAGVLLEGVELPFEGHGHLVLGGPGPVLAYRIGPSAVRLCLDLPVGSAPRTAAGLWSAFGPVLPDALRSSLRDALETAPIAWAANRLRARSYYGNDRVHLLGDAVGAVHPLCAQGITLALGDAVALAACDGSDAYMRRREAESWVAELLSQALYEVVVRRDPAATEVRHAMFRMWRASAFERERTLALLAGRLTGRASFGSAFLHVALRAGHATTRKGARHGLAAAARGLAQVARFHVYPVRALSPGPVRRRHRSRWVLDPAGVSEGHEPRPARSEDPQLVLPPSLAEDGPLRQGIAALRRAVDGGAPEAVAAAAARLIAGCEVQARYPAERLAVARLLREALGRWPGLDGGHVEGWLAQQEEMVRRRVEGEREAVALVEMAQDLELLCLAGVAPADAVVRSLVGRILATQGPNGAFGDGRVIETAAALVSLLRAGAAVDGPLSRAVAYLEVRPGVGPDDELERQLALRLFGEARAHALSALSPGSRGTKASDALRCAEHLEAVSRSFARPIAALSDPLRTAVTCGYLLCRVADTVEDAPGVPGSVREQHLRRFIEVLEGRRGPGGFVDEVRELPASPDEAALLEDTGRVLAMLATVPEPMSASVRQWAAEMARGMMVYVRRPADGEGLTSPLTVRDLERYCYFVAGTVGHMLTDLFLLQLPDLEAERRAQLRAHAEAFGIGLQLVNVLKDVTDDHARGVAYVPAELTIAGGVRTSELVEPEARSRAHDAVGPLFELAHTHLDGALAYVHALPAHAVELRAFCLLPLWMAVRTLVYARGNDAMFQPGVPVKIDRAEVEALASDCLARLSSDADIAKGYAQLWERAPSPTTPRRAKRRSRTRSL